MKDRVLIEKWERLNWMKNSYVFGEESFDTDGFKQTVKETFQFIKNFKILLLGEDMQFKHDLQIATANGIEPNDIFDYANLLVEIGKYSADAFVGDESEDYIFSVSQVITRQLLNYAYFSCGIDPTDRNGVLVGYCSDCGLYPPDDDEFGDNSFDYDPNTGDMSEVMEVVKRYYAAW